MAQTLRLKGSEFVEFKPLWSTWRAEVAGLGANDIITRGELLNYLQGASPTRRSGGEPRVADVAEAAQLQQVDFNFLDT